MRRAAPWPCRPWAWAAAALLRGPAAAASWVAAVRGPCEQVGACVQSPNYPGRYGGQQSCEISVNPWAQESVSAIRFRSERNYDVLTVNGKRYSGHFSRGPQDVVATGAILWSSDDGVESTGWKICRTSEADAVRAAEPPIEARGFEMFIYAFMTVMVVWLVPFLAVAPLVSTVLCILAHKVCKTEMLSSLAVRIAHFPYMLLHGGKAAGDSEHPFNIVGYCILWWGIVSFTMLTFIIILFAAVTFLITYLFGLLMMSLFFMLLTLMESVAERATNETRVSGGQVPAVKYEGKLWQFLRHPFVKWTYRTVALLVIATVISVGVYVQFLVDAMLIESGFDLLPSQRDSSDSPPVYAVMQGMKGDFAVMSIVSPAFELFRPILKWVRACLDWPVACNPAAWSAYSVVCLSATYVQFVWCTTDVASPLYDRQKRLEEAPADETAGNMGFLKQKFYALVVLIILKLNFYTLQLVGQGIVSGFPGMMSHDSKYCEVEVVHPHGIELGYAASWLIARLMSYSIEEEDRGGGFVRSVVV
ncbi:unnamed protein product [Prorocentrum cordatum]|uniref:Uncharacterized protein n=1 Tax=Prorocentrum cordatum TaxID=2364126 RepID=A0ABN9PEG3_9DINO|nr:unnamed protein product [Polarella glacialis]